MSEINARGWALGLVVVLAGCGGRTETGPGAVEGADSGEADARAVSLPDTGGSTTPVNPGGFVDSGFGGTSCGALGDCCYILEPGTHAGCDDIANGNDDPSCAAELTKLQSSGECI